MPTATIRGGPIHYELAGSVGDPLVLVHGTWVDHATWGAVVPLLAPSFRLLTYDLRGHGQSRRDFGGDPVEDHVRDLEELLVATDHYPAHVVGSSLGSSIALRLAAERADLFRSLVVHDPPLLGLLASGPTADLAGVTERMDEIATVAAEGDFRGAAERFVDLVGRGPNAWTRLPPALQEMYVANAPGWLAEYEASRDLGVDLDRLREFDPPVLLTTGETSPLFFDLILERLRSALPNARKVVLPGAGHGPQLTHPGLLVGRLAGFLLERRIPPG